MHSKIVLCLSEKEDEVLDKQIAMLKERNHAEVVRLGADEARDFLDSCESEVLFISDNKELLETAVNKGIATNEPQKMRESYAKAMEMLKALGMT
ncbi:hypothetical protein [Butyrivibrio sp. MC2021]|uniref:hypothetical protein n=1 Tax=Butyrivibrio sp. MC2021 TaxID=1408306 RepID=UPI00047EF682|nr:hypothetical protein [Butyrivibrio sp. MC2021]